MKFYELNFDKDISEMSEDEMAAALAEFAEKHAENIEAFGELKAEFESVKEQLDGRVERLADELSEEQSLLTKDELLEYDLERLEEMADTLDLSEADDEEDEEDETDEEGDDADDEESEEPEFMRQDKPSRAGDFSEDSIEEAREQAKDRLSRIPGLAFDN